MVRISTHWRHEGCFLLSGRAQRGDNYKCYLESSRIFICTGYYGSRSNEGEIVQRILEEVIHTGKSGKGNEGLGRDSSTVGKRVGGVLTVCEGRLQAGQLIFLEE